METLVGGWAEASGPCGRMDRVGSSEHRRVKSDRYEGREPGMEKTAHEQGRSVRKRVEEVCHRTNRADPADGKPSEQSKARTGKLLALYISSWVTFTGAGSGDRQGQNQDCRRKHE